MSLYWIAKKPKIKFYVIYEGSDERKKDYTGRMRPQ
jgi:hypothetical protein